MIPAYIRYLFFFFFFFFFFFLCTKEVYRMLANTPSPRHLKDTGMHPPFIIPYLEKERQLAANMSTSRQFPRVEDPATHPYDIRPFDTNHLLFTVQLISQNNHYTLNDKGKIDLWNRSNVPCLGKKWQWKKKLICGCVNIVFL